MLTVLTNHQCASVNEFQTAGHLVFQKYSPAAGHIVTAFKICPAYCVCRKMNENLCSFLLRAPKKFRHNNSSCLFQGFWTNVSKLAGEFMTENLSQLRPVKFLDQVSVMVLTMTMFVDEMQLRHRGCLCQESSNLKLTRPCVWQIARNGLGRRLRKHKKCH